MLNEKGLEKLSFMLNIVAFVFLLLSLFSVISFDVAICVADITIGANSYIDWKKTGKTFNLIAAILFPIFAFLVLF